MSPLYKELCKLTTCQLFDVIQNPQSGNIVRSHAVDIYKARAFDYHREMEIERMSKYSCAESEVD